MSALRDRLALAVLLLLAHGCRTAGTRPQAPSPGSLEQRVDAVRHDLGEPGEDAAARQELAAVTSDLERALSATPDDAHLHYLLGRAHLYAERDADAVRQLERAAALAPQSAEYHYLLGWTRRYTDDRDGSVAALRKAVELAPSNAKYTTVLGDVLLALDRTDEALQHYERALAAEPEHPGALVGSADALEALGRSGDAMARLKQAVRVSPKDFRARYNLAQQHQNRDEHAEALAGFEAAHALDPTDWHTRAKLVQEYQAAGRLPERDAQLAALRALHEEGKVERPSFVREQFVAEGKRVMVFERFELEGERPVRYAFEVLAPDRKSSEFRISLGSYELTNQVARSSGDLPPGTRLFHLDGYTPENDHFTYGFFHGEPSYETVRGLVVEVLGRRLEPSSSTILQREVKPKASKP